MSQINFVQIMLDLCTITIFIVIIWIPKNTKIYQSEKSDSELSQNIHF